MYEREREREIQTETDRDRQRERIEMKSLSGWEKLSGKMEYHKVKTKVIVKG